MALMLELPREMTIAQAAGLKARLLAALQAGGDVLLDASAVAAVDITGLQLIEAAWQSAGPRKCKLAFAPGKRSAALDRAAADAGLSAAASGGPWKEPADG
jgi:hypothetical protein